MIPVKILAVRYLPGAAPALCKALGVPEGYPSLGLLTTDCDDATYIALDAATKAADVKVCYGRSFYAGAANASTPYAGEVIGVLAGTTPGTVRSGMEAAVSALENIGFTENRQLTAEEATRIYRAVLADLENGAGGHQILIKGEETTPQCAVYIELESENGYNGVWLDSLRPDFTETVKVLNGLGLDNATLFQVDSEYVEKYGW